MPFRHAQASRNNLKTHPHWNAFNRFVPAVVTSTAVVVAGLEANAELIYGVNDELGELISFDSATPGTLLSAHALTGMVSGEQIRGLCIAGSILYGLGHQDHLYIINPATGSCTLAATGFTPVLNGIDFGFIAGTTGFYVSSDLGQNLTINPTTGAATVGPNYTGAVIDAMAYDSLNGQFYGISADNEDLYLVNPATGGTTLIGPTGVNFAHRIGFAISPATSTAYFSGTVSGQTEFFTVNLSTGAMTLVGDVGPPGEFTSGLNSIAVSTASGPNFLTIAFVRPNSVVVAWPASGYSSLQTNDNLSAGNWASYGGTVASSNGTNTLTITPPTGDLYFRLKIP